MTISDSKPTGGTLTADVKKAVAGATVTITATPNKGYALDDVTVKDANKKTVSVSGKGDSRKFTMPKSNVTVSAKFFELYNVKPMELAFGYLSVSQENYVLPGTTVTITAHPEPGYKAVNIRAYDSNGKEIEVKDNGNGTATFTMPSGGGVQPSADFVPKTEEELLAELMGQFTDVKPSDWFYKDAAWAVGRGIMNGVTPTLWVPQDNISTATVVRTLFRLSMGDKTEEERNIILNEYASDIYAENRPWLPEKPVDASQGYYREARWAAANHILTENVFTGNDPISRAKFAVILRNYLRFRSVEVEVPTPYAFSDIAAIEAQASELGENLNEAFQILRAADVFRGDRTDAMLPGNNSTRAHMAALLHRLADFVGEYEKRWTNEPNQPDRQTEES